ncbi:tetratricopeptide repeat protein [Emticicia sp. BO119]|uniref:tetratricopeptide repeat protein n=1 Tax=Emticicia sp. BO119 TaxID=2757768 RepID=UPI0015F038DF|nr:tetratricopeptide repeat protein [Emticicia sp. BO119]MBA4850697.1 tetratricopeptide repeat protein [Emticicia sp. BO119]
MRYSYYFLPFFLFISGLETSFAQAGSQDSIKYFQERLAVQTTPEERAPILAKLAWFYSETGEFEKSMKAATEAIPILEKTKNYERLARVYVSLAQVFQYQNDFAKTLYYTEKALQTIRLTNDKPHIVTATMNYAVSLSDYKRFDESLKVFDDALKMAIEIKDTTNITNIYLNLASAYYDHGDYNKIRQPVNAGLILAYKTKSDDAILRGEAILGAALLGEKKFAEADEHFKKAESLLPEINSPYYDRQMAFIRTEWAALQGNYKEAFNYQKKFYETDTLMANKENRQKVAQLETQLRMNEKELENVNLQNKLAQQKWLFISGAVVLGLLVALFYLQRKSLAQKHDLLQAQHKLSAAELSLVQSQLESFADTVSEKNQLINKFENELKDLKLKDTASTHTLLDQINQARILTDEQWQDFRLKFEKLHPQFITRLHQQNPNLTDTETQMACMIRLNFTNTQVAGMLGISNESVTKNRYRLRKKIEQSDLNSYLSTI